MVPVDADSNRELLDRLTVAVEGIEATLARQEAAFEHQAAHAARQEAHAARQDESAARQEAAFAKLMERWDESDARAQEHHRRLLERSDRESRIFIDALSDIDRNIQRNNDRLDEMGYAIRADTQAVLSVLDRLDPPPG